MHMNVKDGDLVLEIGSGNNPNPRSDVLCDRYLRDNRERAGGFSIVIDRPFVVCDGYRLPFADKAFDYVICSHVFEHMDDPIAFAREVTRVAKAGSIEVPSAISERVFGRGFHHWYGELDKGILAFTRKREGEQFSGFFHRMIARSIWFRRFFEDHENVFYLRTEWNDRSPMSIIRKSVQPAWTVALDRRIDRLLAKAKPEFLADLQFYFQWMARRLEKKIKKEIRRFLWGQGAAFPFEKLRCIVCHERVYRGGDVLKCTYCGKEYKMDGVIPILL